MHLICNPNAFPAALRRRRVRTRAQTRDTYSTIIIITTTMNGDIAKYDVRSTLAVVQQYTRRYREELRGSATDGYR